MPFSSVLGASSVIKPGVCTSTTRPTVPYEGQLIYETDTDRVAAWNGSAWVYTHSSGLVLIKTQTIGSAVSSVTVTGAFSADYDNYLIYVEGGAASASTGINFKLGSTATGYYYSLVYCDYHQLGAQADRAQNASSFLYAGSAQTNKISLIMSVESPFLSEETTMTSWISQTKTDGFSGRCGGYVNNTTSYTDFVLTPGTGTLTGGAIKVYGYRN